MVAKESLVGNFGSLDEIRQLRAPNTLDAILYQRGEDIPKNPVVYLNHIPQFTDLFVYEIGNMRLSDTKKIEDELARQTVLYASENSPFYQNKYKKALCLDGKESLISWVKNNIQASEDLDKLPALTNSDFKNASNGYSWGMMIPGKAEELKKLDISIVNYQTGGTTGLVPSVIPYSQIDKQVAAYEMLAGLTKYAGFKRGGNAVIIAPGQPHPFGPIVETALEKYSNTIHWKHFSPGTTSQKILDFIKILGEREGIDYLIGAPHGPKGAQAAFDVLFEVDEKSGNDIFETYLKGKTAVVGGSPTKKDLAEKLYDVFGKATNQFGSAQFMGGNAPITKVWKDEDGLFSSDAYKPRGYWSVQKLDDPDAPKPWGRMRLTVLGKDIMSIIGYDPGDYVRVIETSEGTLLKNICRTDFFKKLPDGSYTLEIPSGLSNCVSAV